MNFFETILVAIFSFVMAGVLAHFHAPFIVCWLFAMAVGTGVIWSVFKLKGYKPSFKF